MEFLADECCDTSIVALLRADGHDVLFMQEQKPGLFDDEVLQIAYDEKRILITEDKDFGELVYRLKKPSYGVILIRIDVKKRHMKWPVLKKLLENYSERLPGHFIVMDDQKYRFRSLLFSV